jgi:tetratricopeptide (TPR) repeat protein
MNRKQRRADEKQVRHVQGASSAVQVVAAEALQYHRAGLLNDAERLYRQVLTADPRHADSLHLLGIVCRQTGRHDLAVGMFRSAIAINANAASYHSSLGDVLQKQRRVDEAVACYRRALDLRPDLPEAHTDLGDVLQKQGGVEEAVACYHRALSLRPEYPEAHTSLGNALQQLGRLDEAISCARRALDLRPDYPEAYNNLGNALKQEGQLDEAVVCYRRALDLRPDLPEAHNNLGTALKQKGQLDEAVACARRALDLRPDYLDAHNNLGLALREQGRLDEAAACYRSALDFEPDYLDAHINLGTTLREQERLDEAVTCYRTALHLKPDFADAHVGLAMALLARGDMTAGWEEYEWRWKQPGTIKARRNFAQPQWRGEAAAGQTLLIHAEQGFGDTLQFCRYATLAAARGLRVIMQVQKSLVRLLRSLSGAGLVMGIGDELPAFDLHCPMLSMPLALRTTITTIPSATCYLHADEVQSATWRTHLASKANQGPRIGLAWAGNPRIHSPDAAAVDRRRSLPPDRLAPLFEVPGLHFVSLQHGGPVAPTRFLLTDFMHEMDDFADTAALIANLDLVISVDTAVVHLAAALGKPVWMLDRFDPCWRWLVGRRDSPWYPTLRLYRQPHPGDWHSVIAEVARDLRGLAGA